MLTVILAGLAERLVRAIRNRPVCVRDAGAVHSAAGGTIFWRGKRRLPWPVVRPGRAAGATCSTLPRRPRAPAREARSSPRTLFPIRLVRHER